MSYLGDEGLYLASDKPNRTFNFNVTSLIPDASDMKRRYDSPDALYSSAPLPKAPRPTRAARNHRAATERRIARRLSSEGCAKAMAKLAADDAEGRARRLILFEL